MASSIHRSSNCAAYTDTVSLLVDATATVPGQEDKCSVALPPTFSCQTKAFEAPDAATEADLRAKAAAALETKGCDPSAMELSFSTNLVGAQHSEYSPAKLADLGMASNCFRACNDPNDATHQITARCRSMYDMTDAAGRTVRNYNMVFHSNLATCDVSDDAAAQLYEDARKVAAHNASQNGYTVGRVEDLACDFAVLPVL